MSFELYSLIPGQQVKRDRDLSNVTIQCDPLAVYPNNRTAAGVAAAGNRFKPGESGKLAVGEEICDLTINGNLEVKGKLKLNGDIAAEICNIFCPEDFNLRANSSIIEDAGDTFVVTAVNAVDLSTSSTAAGQGNINIGATGFLNIQGLGTTAADVITINTENQNTNAIHLHIPTGTGGPANVADQINIQNQYNTSARSVQIKSDLGGVYVESGGLIQITPGARLKFFNAAGAGGAPSNPGTAAGPDAAVINAITQALINYGLFN